MRFLLFLLLMGAFSCTNTGITGNKPNLNLVEAYYRYSVGGKEQEDDLNAILHYFFLFEENDQVKFSAIQINKVSYDFESFNYEGNLYLVVKTFPKSGDFQTEQREHLASQEAWISYEINEKKKVLVVDEIGMKEPNLGN